MKIPLTNTIKIVSGDYVVTVTASIVISATNRIVTVILAAFGAEVIIVVTGSGRNVIEITVTTAKINNIIVYLAKMPIGVVEILNVAINVNCKGDTVIAPCETIIYYICLYYKKYIVTSNVTRIGFITGQM